MWLWIGIALGVIALFFIALYIIYRITFYSPHKGQDNIYDLPREVKTSEINDKTLNYINRLKDKPYEQVCITSIDGLKLYGKYYHQKDGAPLDIAFHGYRGTDIRDLSGCVTIIEEGERNLLFVDHRAHGKSQGHTITFGIKERYDCLSWVNYAIERFGKDVRIFIRGISMGATTVLMATELNLPDNVYGVLADCPFSSPKDIIKKVCREDMKLPAKLVYPLIWLAGRVYGGFSVSETTAEKAVKKSNIPIMIIHGEEDFYVPTYMSKPVLDARPDIEYYLFPNAGHGLSYMYDTERYENLVKKFVEKHCYNKK